MDKPAADGTLFCFLIDIPFCLFTLTGNLDLEVFEVSYGHSLYVGDFSRNSEG